MLNKNIVTENVGKLPQFDGHVQAWKAAKIEEFWLQAVSDDRAETALPPPELWGTDDAQAS